LIVLSRLEADYEVVEVLVKSFISAERSCRPEATGNLSKNDQ